MAEQTTQTPSETENQEPTNIAVYKEELKKYIESHSILEAVNAILLAPELITVKDSDDEEPEVMTAIPVDTPQTLEGLAFACPKLAEFKKEHGTYETWELVSAALKNTLFTLQKSLGNGLSNNNSGLSSNPLFGGSKN